MRLRGAHPVMTLMRWASVNRGITFTSAAGDITCELPDALRAGYER
jgi:hypothetical protein